MTIISEASIGIGSVGISPLPVLLTTFSTSGNLDKRICADAKQASVEVFKLLPVNTLVSTAKSPSGSSGINSPPNLDKMKTAKKKSTMVADKIVLG